MDLQTQINDLKRRLDDLSSSSLIPYTVERAFKERLGDTVLFRGTGSTALTETRSLTGNPQVINVPTAYAGSELFTINGKVVEIPYISII